MQKCRTFIIEVKGGGGGGGDTSSGSGPVTLNISNSNGLATPKHRMGPVVLGQQVLRVLLFTRLYS